MATEQAYYALTAYYRFVTGSDALYDMTAVSLTSGGSTGTHTHSYQDGKCTICGAKDPNFKPVIIKGSAGCLHQGRQGRPQLHLQRGLRGLPEGSGGRQGCGRRQLHREGRQHHRDLEGLVS